MYKEKFKINKSGFSHIEVVLSFIFFISVVVFSLYFLGNTNESITVGGSLTNAQEEIEKALVSEFSSMSVSLVGKSGIVGFDLIKDSEDGIIVMDEVEILLDSYYSGGKIYFDSGAGDKIYTIRFGKDIDSSSSVPFSSSVDLVDGEYNLGSIVELDAISEKKIIALKEEYDQDYDDLKDIFRLGNNVEFGFRVNFAVSPIFTDKLIPEGSEIFLNNKRLEILRENGKLEFAELEVSVW